MKRCNRQGGRQRGRSLIELLIAVALGLVVLGAVLVSVAGSGQTGRAGNEMARVGDDGQLALNLLAAQLRMAGFSMPRKHSVPGSQAGNYGGVPVRACDEGFVSATAVGVDQLECASGGQSAVSVLYEADTANTYPGTANEPTSCLGAQLAAIASPLGGQYALAENRFYIRTNPGTGNPALYCYGASSGSPPAQPLVDNVEKFVLQWGISDGFADKMGRYTYGGDATAYFTASELDTAFASDADRWSRVTSARICVLMRSAPGVTAQATPHVDCDGSTVSPADVSQRRLRRALHATVQLRNRGFSL